MCAALSLSLSDGLLEYCWVRAKEEKKKHLCKYDGLPVVTAFDLLVCTPGAILSFSFSFSIISRHIRQLCYCP